MEQAILAWVFTGLLLVLLIGCVLAARGSIPLNHWFGVRIPALMQSDSAWRAGHAAGVVPAAIAFTVALVCAVSGSFASAFSVGSVAAFLGGVVWVMLAANHRARAA